MEFKDLTKLPSPPGVAVKLLELYSSADVSINDLCDVIGTDPVLAARTVKFANSPMFARRHEATSLKQAVTMLGSNGVKMIALSFSLTEIAVENCKGKFQFNDFWNFSLATATSAKATYKSVELDPDTGFLVGLLMNIGQLAMYCVAPNRYNSLLGSVSANDISLLATEKNEYGESRYEVGAQVLTNWDFPEAISSTLSLLAGELETGSAETRALELANQMSYLFMATEPDSSFVQSFSDELSVLTGKDSEGVEELYGEAFAEYVEMATILSYKMPEARSLREIELEAKVAVLDMTLDLHMANTQVRAENNQLKDMAYIDELTGLGNRRNYESMAQGELTRCARMKRSFGLIVIDIDHFKSVNDTHGHAAGDAILAGVAKRMDKTIREYDYLFRFGGEEFVLIAPETSEEECATIAERLRKTVGIVDFEFENTTIPITISLGGAIYHPGDSADLGELFSAADSALYEAKESGRNRYVLATTEVAIAKTPGNAQVPPPLMNDQSQLPTSPNLAEN